MPIPISDIELSPGDLIGRRRVNPRLPYYINASVRDLEIGLIISRWFDGVHYKLSMLWMKKVMSTAVRDREYQFVTYSNVLPIALNPVHIFPLKISGVHYDLPERFLTT